MFQKEERPFCFVVVGISPHHPLSSKHFKYVFDFAAYQRQAERLLTEMMPLMMLEGRMWNMVEMEGKNETTVNDNRDESRDVPHDAHDLWTHE